MDLENKRTSTSPATASTPTRVSRVQGLSRARRTVAATAALASIAIGLAGCSSGSSSPASPTATTAPPSSGSPTAAVSPSQSTEKVPLVIYAAEGYDQAMVDAFQKATGIPTKLYDDSTGTLLAKISAEANNPQWGLLWTDGAESYAALDQQGMLVKGFQPTSGTLNSLGQQQVPADQSYIPTGVTIAGAIVYNASVVTNPPTTWSQLLDPAWKGAVGMNNPALSGPTFPFVAGIMEQLGGLSQGEQFFQQLKSNGLHVFSTNKVTLTALVNGQIKLAIVQNSAAIGFALKSPQLKVAYPNKVAVLPSVMGIDAKVSAAEIAEAKQFANFVYSKQGQDLMLSGDPHGDSLFIPIVNGTVGHSEVPSLATLQTISPDPFKWGPQEADINKWFTDKIAQ